MPLIVIVSLITMSIKLTSGNNHELIWWFPLSKTENDKFSVVIAENNIISNSFYNIIIMWSNLALCGMEILIMMLC